MKMITDIAWLLDHAEITQADRQFVWQYWTDVSHWDDPPARFHLDGPFESGSRGVTMIPDRESLHWEIRDVRPGQAYTIVSELDGANLLCRWSFESMPDGATRLRQRIGVAGPDSDQHAELVRQGFGPTLADGMRRIAKLLDQAQAKAEEAG